MRNSYVYIQLRNSYVYKRHYENIMEKFSLHLANLITLLRIILVIIFSLLFLLDYQIIKILLLIISILIFITDIIDGTIARRLGSASPPEVGSILDSSADTFVIITLCLCFYSADIIPFFLTLLAIWTRLIITIIRLLAAVLRKPNAKTKITTKIKGWSYGLAMLYFVVVYIFFPKEASVSNVTQIINGYLTIITIISVTDFIYTYRQIVFDSFSDK